MKMSKREFLKNLGFGGAALAGGAVFADEYVPMKSRLPAGSVGDPDNLWFAKNIFPLPHTVTDGPSCTIQGGRIMQPAREIPVFHKTDVLVVGGGSAGFAAALAASRQGAKVTLIERYGSLGGLFTNGSDVIGRQTVVFPHELVAQTFEVQFHIRSSLLWFFLSIFFRISITYFFSFG